jgi:hypothetical protein
MRAFVLAFFILVTPALADFDCGVTCPPGYLGGCVKSEKGCDCSCRKGSKDLRQQIISILASLDASTQLRQEADSLLLKNPEKLEVTLTDKQTSKRFTVIVKRFGQFFDSDASR